jgi:hypothetical protein
MSPERHQRVRELFDGALEKPEDERLTYLQSASSDDPEVLDAVVRLLKAHTQSDTLPRARRAARATDWTISCNRRTRPRGYGRRLRSHRSGD